MMSTKASKRALITTMIPCPAEARSAQGALFLLGGVLGEGVDRDGMGTAHLTEGISISWWWGYSDAAQWQLRPKH